MGNNSPKTSASPAIQAPPMSGTPKRRRPLLKWLFIVVPALVIGYAIIVRPLSRPAERARSGGARTVPVVAEPARTTNLKVRVFSLGTVTPVNSVTVRSRVDGQLQKILFEEGRAVEAGAPLAEIDPRPFEAQKQQVEAQRAKDTTLLENARLDLERFNKLLAQESISKQQVDTQQALVRQFEASVRLDQAQVDTAELQLSYAHITSPISGRTGLRLVDQGNMIHASDNGGIVVITQLSPISVVFTIPQDVLPRILKRFKGGDPMEIETFDRDGRTLLAKGKLITIDNQIDPSTGTVKLRAEFPNEDEQLFPNQFVNVQLIAEQIEDVTVVSQAAVQRGAAGTFVYVVVSKDDQKTVSVRPVETGPAERSAIAISKGITPGELVVVDGVDKLREGSSVEVVTRSTGPSDQKPGKPGKSGGKRSREGKAPKE